MCYTVLLKNDLNQWGVLKINTHTTKRLQNKGKFHTEAMEGKHVEHTKKYMTFVFPISLEKYCASDASLKV